MFNVLCIILLILAGDSDVNHGPAHFVKNKCKILSSNISVLYAKIDNLSFGLHDTLLDSIGFQVLVSWPTSCTEHAFTNLIWLCVFVLVLLEGESKSIHEFERH